MTSNIEIYFSLALKIGTQDCSGHSMVVRDPGSFYPDVPQSSWPKVAACAQPLHPYSRQPVPVMSTCPSNATDATKSMGDPGPPYFLLGGGSLTLVYTHTGVTPGVMVQSPTFQCCTSNIYSPFLRPRPFHVARDSACLKLCTLGELFCPRHPLTRLFFKK